MSKISSRPASRNQYGARGNHNGNRGGQSWGPQNSGSWRQGLQNRGSRNNAPTGGPRRASKPVTVISKKDAITGFMKTVTHSSKFVAANSGGLMAAIKVGGRVVFPERRGPQPQNDGKVWQFQIVGENPKQTVYFARIVEATASTALKFVIDRSGKICCVGRPRLVMPFRTTKPKNVAYAEFRHATPNMGFERNDDDWYFADDGYGSYSGCGCGCDHDCDCEESDRSDFDNEVESIWNHLPTKPVNCHACGFEDCRCDGTASDWVPARTTLNLLG